ncbi:helix-turn-helix domain-containing protein [Nocardia sp. NPDC003482]
MKWTGREAAALREATRLGQERFAAWAGVSVEAVKKWERRKESIRLTPRYALRMDHKLRQSDPVVVERFWSILNGPATVKVETAHELDALLGSGIDSESVWVPKRTVTGEVVLVPVPRRDFVLGIGAGVAGATLSSQPLAAVFADTKVDHIRHFTDKRMTIIESDNLYGARHTLPEVLTAIQRMQALRLAKTVDAQALLRLLVMYAETAAWQFQDQRMFSQSRHWAEKALAWSHQLGDDYCIGLSLVRMSQLACDMDDFTGGKAFAEGARRTAPPNSLFAAAAVTFCAHAEALAGDRSASARSYDKARSMVNRAEADPVWGFFLDHSYIDAYQAFSLAEIGETRSATVLFADATARMQAGYPRDRGLYVARTAVAHMRTGDMEPAVRLGLEALRIGLGTESGRIMAKVGELRRAVDPGSKEPGVDEFVTAYQEWKDLGCPDHT